VKVEVVQLENIRSHTKSTVPFNRGFNCLVGGLGCGKSSVLYSIDFALFGDPVGRSYEYLMREGADYAKVTLQFSHNGNTYLLTRGLRRRGKGISQDLDALRLFQDDKLIASGKADAVAEQLKSITGFDRELWREIVWVRQEHLKELIDAAPRERQKRLDELFGLSDYETAWSNIAPYQRDYETEKRLLENDPDVKNKEHFSEEYNRVTEEYTLLELELADASEKMEIMKRLLDEADADLKQVEQKKQAVEELQRKETRLHANVQNLQDAQAALGERIENKKTVITNLQQRQADMDAQIANAKAKLSQAGFQADQPIDQLRRHLTEFDDKISALRGEQEALNRNMQTDQKRLQQLGTQTENQCPVCLQPLGHEYKDGLVQRMHTENLERQKAVLILQRQVTDLQRAKMAASEAFSNLQIVTSRAEEIRMRIAEEENNLTQLHVELKQKGQLYDEFGMQLQALQDEIAGFDLSDLESARTKREKAFQQYYTTQSEVRTKEARKTDLLRRLDEIKQRIDAAQQKVERIETVTRAVEMVGNIRLAYRSIQPKLRSEFVKVLRNFVQQVLDSLAGGEAQMLNVVIDETYTPWVKSDAGMDREVANLSGGERTLLAFAYRLGLGQLIMQSRTGHGLGMLLLDEPTENLGTEDGSITRLADSISRFKAIEQIIAVTHSEDFAEKASHVIVLEKEAGISKASIDRE
jgi:exonuclease SbcC